MSYVFNELGTYLGVYPDGDPRVFIVWNLTVAPTRRQVADAVSFPNPTILADRPILRVIHEAVLRDLAATVASESSHNAHESESIFRVVRNRAELKGAIYGASNFWSLIGGSGIFGRTSTNYASYLARPLEQWQSLASLKTDLSATVRGIVSPSDVTAGAYFWLATFAETGNNIFGNGLAATPPVFVVNVRWGATSFLKYNPGHPIYGTKKWP
jgi:hypothetical protein